VAEVAGSSCFDIAVGRIAVVAVVDIVSREEGMADSARIVEVPMTVGSAVGQKMSWASVALVVWESAQSVRWVSAARTEEVVALDWGCMDFDIAVVVAS
jgi:hypothetical protein